MPDIFREVMSQKIEYKNLADREKRYYLTGLQHWINMHSLEMSQNEKMALLNTLIDTSKNILQKII